MSSDVPAATDTGKFLAPILVHDNFLRSADEARRLTTPLTNPNLSLLPHLFSSAGERKIAFPCSAANSPLSEDVVRSSVFYDDDDGLSSLAVTRFASALGEVRRRVRAAVEDRGVELLPPDVGRSVRFEEAGCIFSWLSEIDDLAGPEVYSYTLPHVDKDNNKEYDITTLLYLNDAGETAGFEGGNLAFLRQAESPAAHSATVEGDADPGVLCEELLEPRLGRLVMFGSDARNRHRVERVTRGNRFLLSVWYRAHRSTG